MSYFLILFSCNTDREKEILPPQTMQQVFWDFIKADAYVANYVTKDSALDPQLISANLQQQIFKKYKISKKQFDKSYTYYLEHDKELLKITDSIITKNQREQLSKFAPEALPAKISVQDSVPVKRSRIKRLNLDSPTIKKPTIKKKLYE